MGSLGLPEIALLLLLSLAVMLVPAICYILTLYRALGRCAPENRTMDPGLAWLLLVPVVGLVWHFMVVLNISRSLKQEFSARGIACEPEPGKSVGLTLCILSVCSIIPFVGPLAGLGALVCWIVYWARISSLSQRIALPALAMNTP